MQPTYAQTSAVPGTRIRKPALDEMGSARNRPIPARAPSPRSRGGVGEPAPRARVDPRTKAGAYGEQINGPHKPTLDEMGPHAERGLPVADKPVPLKPPARRPLGGSGRGDPAEKKKHRHGRPRKTGRPGA